MNTNFEVHPTTPGIFPGVKVSLTFPAASFGYPSSEVAAEFLALITTKTEAALRTLLDELNTDHAELVEQEKDETAPDHNASAEGSVSDLPTAPSTDPRLITAMAQGLQRLGGSQILPSPPSTPRTPAQSPPPGTPENARP